MTRIAIHVNHLEHQQTHGVALRAGFARHCIEAVFALYGKPVACDIAVIWGWRQPHVVSALRARGGHVLVCERGYLGDRFAWTSLGWNGLNGLAMFPEPADNGQRFRTNFGHLLKPWREQGDYALLCGQVQGDASLGGLDVDRWAKEQAEILRSKGHEVRFRRHPLSLSNRREPQPPIAEDLRRATLCVTYSSNSGVEAVLEGVPTVAMSPVSMAWPVATHDLNTAPRRPDRGDWCCRLSWCQWTMDEIADGTAWAHVREAIA